MKNDLLTMIGEAVLAVQGEVPMTAQGEGTVLLAVHEGPGHGVRLGFAYPSHHLGQNTSAGGNLRFCEILGAMQ